MNKKLEYRSEVIEPAIRLVLIAINTHATCYRIWVVPQIL